MYSFLKRTLTLNKALKALLYTNSVILLASAMVVPIYALFVEEVGGSLLDASFAGAAFAFAGGITTIVSGRYTDRVKQEEHILVFGYCVVGAGFLSYYLVDSIWTLLIAQMVIGFGEAIYAPAFDVLYSKHLGLHKEGIGWGTWESVYRFTTGIGAIVGGLVASLFGFKVLFFLISLLCFMAAFFTLRISKRLL